MNVKLAENIKKLRTERGMSQKELADRLTVSPQAVSRWENGQAYPDIEMLPRIAEMFRVSMDTLMGTGPSFLQRKRKELREAREQVKGAQDYAGRRRVCEILEELAAEGSSQTEFLKEALSLHQIGGVGVDVVERARAYCRELLAKSSGDDRIRHLTTILCIEDSQNVERWREFVSNDSFCSCWDDLLLRRYTLGNKQLEQFESTRQRVVHETLWKLVCNLTSGRPDPNCRVGSYLFQSLEPYETYRLAMDMIDLFALKEEDILLDMRLYVEIRMAAALFAKGRDEEGFATVETIMAHLEMFEGLYNTVRRESVGVFSKFERSTSELEIRRCLDDIGFQLKRREFDRVREDSRFAALYRRVEGIDEAEMDAMMSLCGSYHNTIGKNDLLLSVLTADGRSHRNVIRNTQRREKNGAHPDEQALIDTLRDAGNTEIRYIVCQLRNGGFDIPSYFFRKKLQELNPANDKAKILLKGAFRYIVKTLRDTEPPRKEGDNKRTMNESYLQLAHAVIRRILPETGTDYPTFKYQYENAEVAEAKLYRRGFDIRFRLKEGVPAVEVEGERTYGTVSAQIPGLMRGMGFVLWVKNGMIQSLEGYSYEEDLPEIAEEYTLHYGNHMKVHICRAEFLAVGDFDPEWLEETLGIFGKQRFKKGELDPITQEPCSISVVSLGWAEEFGADINANNVIRKALRDVLPLADKLAMIRVGRDIHYSLSLKIRIERDHPESAPDMSLAPDVIAFLNATRTHHELSMIP